MVTAPDVVAVGRSRLRLSSWRGRTDTAECAPLPAGAPVTAAVVADAVTRAEELGYRTLVTPAMAPSEWRPFVDAGFAIHERLHLLGHDLDDLPPRTRGRTRRAGRRDLDRVLSIDHAAFEPFWRLDRRALDDALAATATTRLRLDPDRVGYCLVGRTGDRGYVQRLAVDPAAQGAGRGHDLLVDGLWWLRRWRCRDVLVNTQQHNERALALYERIGFRVRPGGLAVLAASTDAAAPGTP